MKDAEYWLAAAGGVATLMVAWFAGRWVTGADAWVLRLGIAALGGTVIGAFLWPRIRAASQRRAADAAAKSRGDKMPSAEGPSGSLIGEIEGSLGQKLADVPIVLLLNPDGTEGSSLIENCGLELQAIGNVNGGRAWVADGTVFLEIKPSIYDDNQHWTRLIGSFTPPRLRSMLKRGAQAPRGVVVTVAAPPFMLPASANDVHDLAVKLRGKLREISHAIGTAVPVYVVFTGINDLPHFEPYGSKLRDEFAAQPFGVTFGSDSELKSGGVWAEQQSNRIARGLRSLFELLSSQRLDVLAQEQTEDRRQNAYLFPREFKKLSRPGPMSDFLLELSRPFQLGASPALRGFYFAGVQEWRRPPADDTQSAAQKTAEDWSLTRVLSRTGSASPKASEAAKPRRGTEWIFTRRLFIDVVLADLRALRGAFVSSRVSLTRRIALAGLGLALLTAGLSFTISYVSNRGLQKRAATYGRALSGGPMAVNARISTDQLRTLESLRQELFQLRRFRDSGEPLRLGFGLYTGNELYPEVRKAYFDRFSRLMLGPIQRDVSTYLLSQAASRNAPAFDPAYEALKAYVITRLHPEKSTREFLSPVLLKWWGRGETDTERKALAQAQFDFCATELRADPPYPRGDVDKTIAEARRYLQENFAGIERVYVRMKDMAGQDSKSIKFSDSYPEAADVIVDTPEIPAAFTKSAWSKMQSLIKNPGLWLQAEEWVVAMGHVDATKVAGELSAKYTDEYGRRWSEFLQKSKVIACRTRTSADAVKRLTTLSSPQSPLLGLFCMAAENTEVDAPEIAGAFQAVRRVVPQGCSLQLTGHPNRQYVAALFAIKEQMADPSLSAPSADRRAAVAPQVRAAREAIHAIESNLPSDPRWQVHKDVARLISAPVAAAETCSPGLDITGACAELRALKTKYPFTPRAPDASIQEFDAFFNPKTGTLWSYQQQTLVNLVVERGGKFFPNPAAPRPVRNEFMNFLNRAAEFRNAFYSSGAAPQMNVSVRVTSSPGISSVSLRIGKTTQTFTAGQTDAKLFTWSPADPGADLHLQGTADYSIPGRRFDGPWAFFQLTDGMTVAAQTDTQISFEWIVREDSSKAAVEYKGRPLTVRLDITGSGVGVLAKNSRAGLNCVSQVTQ